MTQDTRTVYIAACLPAEVGVSGFNWHPDPDKAGDLYQMFMEDIQGGEKWVSS